MTSGAYDTIECTTLLLDALDCITRGATNSLLVAHNYRLYNKSFLRLGVLSISSVIRPDTSAKNRESQFGSWSQMRMGPWLTWRRLASNSLHFRDLTLNISNGSLILNKVWNYFRCRGITRIVALSDSHRNFLLEIWLSFSSVAESSCNSIWSDAHCLGKHDDQIIQKCLHVTWHTSNSDWKFNIWNRKSDINTLLIWVNIMYVLLGQSNALSETLNFKVNPSTNHVATVFGAKSTWHSNH